VQIHFFPLERLDKVISRMLEIPLPIDLQQAAELAHRTGRHLL
jgi:hypothetical protein